MSPSVEPSTLLNFCTPPRPATSGRSTGRLRMSEGQVSATGPIRGTSRDW